MRAGAWSLAVVLLGATGCKLGQGGGVAAEYTFLLEEEARFEVRASSEIERGDAREVELFLALSFVDDGEPVSVPVRVESASGDAMPEPELLDQQVFYADVDLVDCAESCVEEVDFVLLPELDAPREVFVSIELTANGFSSSYEPWNFLDLGVSAPAAAAGP